MPVTVRGAINIVRKNGRKGAFNVGALSSEIGEFEVKDALIEEFEPGRYEGQFVIDWLENQSYCWRGMAFVKTVATLQAMFIDAERAPEPDDDGPPVHDPVEQAPAPHAVSARSKPEMAAAADSQAPASAPAPDLAPAPSATTAGHADDADLQLFGAELFEQLNTDTPIKLDPSVDRVVFRSQRDRLKALGYAFDAMAQAWSRQH